MPNVSSKPPSLTGRSSGRSSSVDSGSSGRPSTGQTTPTETQASLSDGGQKQARKRHTLSRGKSEASLSNDSASKSSSKSRGQRALDDFKKAASSWLSPKSSTQSLPLAGAMRAPLAKPTSRPVPKRSATLADASAPKTGLPKAVAFLKRQVSWRGAEPKKALAKDFALKAGIARTGAESARLHGVLTELGYLGTGGRLVKQKVLLSEQTVLLLMQASAKQGLPLGPREAATLLVRLGVEVSAAMGERGKNASLARLQVKVLPRAERKDFFLAAGLTESRGASRQAMRILKEAGVLSGDYLPNSVMALTSRVTQQLQQIEGFADALKSAAAEAAGDAAVRAPSLRKIIHALFFQPG